MIMVAAISSAVVLPDSKSSAAAAGNSRPPLLPSERENGGPHQHQQQHYQQRRPRAREVASRYMSSMAMSPSSSNSFSNTTTSTTTTTASSNSTSSSSSSYRRCPSPSPLVSSRSGSNSNSGSVRSTSIGAAETPRRSQSVDRRRSVTPKSAPVANAGEISAATKLLVTSTRSLSVSFQGEAFSFPISKTKAVNQGGNSVRKATPERRRSTPVKGRVDGGGGGGGDEVERLNSNSNSKPGDQMRWPARARQLNMLSRSLECSDNDGKEFVGSRVVARALHDSLLDEGRRVSFDGILNLDSGSGDVLNGIGGAVDARSVNESSVPSDLTASDSESVSSGSSGARETSGGSRGRSGPRGIMGSAKFWQETNMRLRRLQEPGLGLSSSPSSKFVAPPKLTQSRKFSDGPMTSPRTMSSPIRGAVRAASPSKLMGSSVSSPMRGLSPSRVRSSTGGSMCGSPWDAPSVLSFAVDVRRGKVGENQIVDVHQLRLLYNRKLQWRFVNARTDEALAVQRLSAEKNLWNACISLTALRDSVRHKRIQVQLLRQKLKLTSILRGQIMYLEEWSLLDKDHSNSLQGAIEALKASTLRLPVVAGATADVQSVKEAVNSAVDVMQSMASSTCSLLTRVEEIDSLMTELSNVATKERNSLENCRKVLSMLTGKEVKDCSLRIHLLQLNRSPVA